MVEKSFTLNLTAGEGYRFTVDFDGEGVPPLQLDEPEPLGEGAGPNATRLLAAAVANCLSASLLFCFRKARIETAGFRAVVEAEIVRNEENRMRVGRLDVALQPDMTAEDQERMDRCLGLFEDFCIVTESVRKGIEVNVEVRPRTVTPESGELAGVS